MLGRSEYYFPIFEEALDAECMPLELKYLPVIESALNPKALSRRGPVDCGNSCTAQGKCISLKSIPMSTNAVIR